MNKYEGKREYAAQVMHDEARKVEGVLTEEQIAIIADVRTMRHNIHSEPTALFNSEHGANREYTRWLSEVGWRAREANSDASAALPPLKLPYGDDMLITDYDVYYADEPMGYDEAYEAYLRQHSAINDALEAWLMAIDKMYGTAFAPTGWGRMNG